MRSYNRPNKNRAYKGVLTALFALLALFLIIAVFPPASYNPAIPAQNIVADRYDNQSLISPVAKNVQGTSALKSQVSLTIPFNPQDEAKIPVVLGSMPEQSPSASASTASTKTLPLNPDEPSESVGQGTNPPSPSAAETKNEQNDAISVSAQVLSPENLPSGEEEVQPLPSLLDIFLRSFFSYKTLLSHEMPFIYGTKYTVNDYESMIEEQEMAPDEIPQEIQLEIKKIQNEKEPSHTLPAEGYQVLIYHTHTQEAYRQTDNETYVECGRWRTADQTKNIVHVGDVLQKELEGYGFGVLHDKTNHEPPELNTSYTRSLATIKKNLKDYKSLRVFIDLHRDASTNKDDVVTIDGKRCARIMFVVGMGKSASIKPDWKENYKLAKAISDKLNAIAPNFARDVRIKEIRSYNQYVSDLCMLIEVGHNANTLEEAQNSMPYLAKALSQVIKVQK